MPDGIFLPANSTQTKYTFQSGVMVKNITLFVTKKWLSNNTNKHDNYLSNVILSSGNYFLFEEINYQMLELIKQIEHTLLNNIISPLSKINIYANTLKLMHILFEKIINRPVTNKQMLNILPRHIQGLFKVKTILINQYTKIPSTSFLATQCGINQRQLQRLFKQVFGKSIYQFAMSVKMNEAKKMLLTKKYNVSEVGYLVGYSNLSHFTEKFYQHFGITPKSFLLAN